MSTVFGWEGDYWDLGLGSLKLLTESSGRWICPRMRSHLASLGEQILPEA